MKDEILSYREMCDQEGVQVLQRGMNYRLNPHYSVILFSQRVNAPYKDKIYDDGITLEYEGHDVPKTGEINPKKMDQPQFNRNGNPTENGKFINAIDSLKKGMGEAEIVRAYEKIFSGIWSEKGFFKLIDYKIVIDENKRKVFRFILEETDVDFVKSENQIKILKTRTRLIPSEIKKEVWKRDGGKCVLCGSKDELHFDHDLPYSRGGTSVRAENVRILCARHNLQKSNKIE